MKPTILVVDDSEIVLAMARDALEEAGFEVQTAVSAGDADRFLFSARKPDLVILDVMLPVLDGDRKAKMLKENPETKSIPILLISSKPEADLMVRTREAGAEGYIRKPFTNEAMVASVRDALKAHAR